MKIDPGACSWTLGQSDPARMLETLIDLRVDHYHYCEDTLETAPEHLRDISRAAGLRISAVDPFDAFPQSGVARNETNCLALFEHHVDFAARCGADAICLQGVGIWAGHFDDRPGGFQRVIAKLTDRALSCGIRPVIEIVNRYESPMLHSVDEALEILASPLAAGLRLVLDSFHMQIEEADPLAALRRALPYLHEYQISDSNRGAIGEGHIPFAAHRRELESVNFSGDLLVETVLPECGFHDAPKDPSQRARLIHQQRSSIEAWAALAD